MPSSKPTIDLTKVPFGGPNCGILVYEENNSDGTDIKPGLYFGARIQGGEYRRIGGIVDIVPMVDGKPVSYTYEVTPTLLKLTAEQGEINLIIDTDSTARIFGKGLGVRLYTKFPFYSMMDATIRPGNLLDLSLGGTSMNGGHYMMKPLKGKPVCYSEFNPSTNGPEDAQAELWPDENGNLDFEIYTMNPDEWGYVEYTSTDEACKKVNERFEAYKAAYPAFPEKYADLLEPAAYSVWINKEKPNENDIYPTMLAHVFYSNQLNNGWANAYEQPLHALAFKDTAMQLDAIKSMYVHMKNGMLPCTLSITKVQYQATPPIQGLAVLDLLEKTEGKLDASAAEELYGFMKENYEWWKNSHSYSDFRFSYNHRDELSIKGASYNALEFPLETPDLYTFMILYTKALEKLAAIINADASVWANEAKGLKDTLMDLWDGEGFNCRAAVSGEKFATNSIFAYFPILIGNELGDEIKAKLIKTLEEKFLTAYGFRSESKDSKFYDPSIEGRGAVTMWIQELIVYGLFGCGEKALGERAATAILDKAMAGELASVTAPEGDAVVYRPGAAINAVTGSAIITIASKL